MKTRPKSGLDLCRCPTLSHFGKTLYICSCTIWNYKHCSTVEQYG